MKKGGDIILCNSDKHFLGMFTKEQLYANIAMLTVVVFWGLSYISIKVTVNDIPPTTMALIRFSIASILLWIIHQKVEPHKKIAKEDIPKVAASGILGVTLYFYFENIGVKLSTASNASLIAAIIPIIAISLDICFFRSKASLFKMLAILMTIAGMYLSITGNGKINFGSSGFLGNMFMLAAMISWSLYTLLNKSLQSKYSLVVLTTYQTIIGTLFLIPLSAFEYSEWNFPTLIVWGNILFLSVFCSVLCYLLYMYVLRQLDVAITTLYLNLVPIIGVVSGYLILNEQILLPQLVGGAITLIAIVIVNCETIMQRRIFRNESCHDH
ncbi:MAG: DMT(drug/metabolite transporter) superfamily permease [Firmicutes bacterium]|nr:DMT(drug/metabolite transporter) superfamily permease [Bacillota bacterium]